MQHLSSEEGDVPAAVPEIEYQIAQELELCVLYIDRRTQPSDILRDIIAEDDAAHRGLPRS